MEFGLFLQPFHHPSTDPTEDLENDLELIELLDELGYAEVWIGEHHSTGWENIGSPEVVIAAAAQRTERIRFGTGVVQAGLHHPLVALDRIILLDHLTRGRVDFGIGVGGGIPKDLAVFGLSAQEAGKRMHESLDVMLRLLDDAGPVTERTDWFELHEAVLQLKPYTKPHMRFAVASADPRNVALMGRLGGRVLLGGMPERVEQVFEALVSGAADGAGEASRDQIELSYMLHIAEDQQTAEEELRDGAVKEFYEFQVDVNGRPEPEGSADDWYQDYLSKHIVGDPEHAIERIGEIERISGGIGGILFMSRDWVGVESARRSWRLFAEEVAPKFA